MDPKTTRQIETDRRRALILETAVRAFLELGYQRTGIREIAKRAGVSLGNLYNHFPSKEAVLIEIARLEAIELAPFSAGLRAEEPAIERLRRFLTAYFRYACQEDAVLLSVEILAEAVRSPAVAEAFDPARADLIHALAGCLAEACGGEQGDPARLMLELIEAQARHLVFSGQTWSSAETVKLGRLIGRGIGIDLAES